MLNMAVLEVLRHVQIMEYRSSGDDTFGQLVYTKAFEIGGVELFSESVIGRVRRHHPIVQFEGEVAVAKIGLKQVTLAAHVQHFLRCEIREQFVDIVSLALGNKELTGTDIEEADAYLVLSEVDTSDKGVLFLLEGCIGIAHAGSNQLRDATFHEFLREFRVFELVTNSDAQSCTD